jgi:hypothetical protein
VKNIGKINVEKLGGVNQWVGCKPVGRHVRSQFLPGPR